MNWVDRYFVLKNLYPFSSLAEGELAHLAQKFIHRRYGANTLVAEKGEVLLHLYLIASGDILDDEKSSMPRIFGTVALLDGKELDTNLSSGPEDTSLLLLSKRHYLTMVAQLPELLLHMTRNYSSKELMR
jgi:signal-transduction protein with cAMP-binding, CBS, and nucleotidyltransferase domain